MGRSYDDFESRWFGYQRAKEATDGVVLVESGRRAWTVLVRGMDSTITIGNAKPLGDAGCKFTKEIKGSYSAAPELVGVRDTIATSGRMMVFPFHTAHTFSNFNSWFFDDAMMVKGSGGYRSDGLKLFVNCSKLCRQIKLPGYFLDHILSSPRWRPRRCGRPPGRLAGPSAGSVQEIPQRAKRGRRSGRRTWPERTRHVLDGGAPER